MTSILIVFASRGLLGATKAAPAELARLLAESSVVVITVSGRSPLAPHIEGIICRSGRFDSNTQLRFAPPLSHMERETEETFDGTNQRMILTLHQARGSWDLVSRHFGWIPLSSHKIAFRRCDTGPDPLNRYSGHDFLRIENDLLLPGNLAKDDHGFLSENDLIAWIRKSFAASHRPKRNIRGSAVGIPQEVLMSAKSTATRLSEG